MRRDDEKGICVTGRGLLLFVEIVVVVVGLIVEGGGEEALSNRERGGI